MKLRKPFRHEVIVADIRQAIAGGDLRPGDRLLPYSVLCERYGVTQFVLDRALAELSKAGLIERRPRVGIFVRAAAIDIEVVTPAFGHEGAATAEDEGGGGRAQLAARHVAVTSLLDGHSRPAGGDGLRLFVTDGYPAQLELWRQVLSGFEREHPGSGVTLEHVEDDVAASWERAAEADVVIATTAALHNIGASRFLPLDDPGAVGLDLARLHGKLAAYVASRKTLVGVPFQLVPPLFYWRLDSGPMPTGGRATTTDDTVRAFLARLRDITHEMPEHKRLGWSPGNWFSLLVQDGAIGLDDNGIMLPDWPRLRRLVAALLEVAALAPHPAPDTGAAFVAGRLAGIYSGLYFSLLLREHARFGWAACPVPVSAGANGSELPVLCCAIRRNTAWLPECLDLARHLYREDSQRLLASHGHAVPVYDDLAFAPELLASAPLDAAELRRVLANACLEWGESDTDRRLMQQIARIGQDAEAGGLAVDEAVTRIEWVFHQYQSRER